MAIGDAKSRELNHQYAVNSSNCKKKDHASYCSVAVHVGVQRCRYNFN